MFAAKNVLLTGTPETAFAGSMYLDGTGDYLNVVGSGSDLKMETGSWTFECWVFVESLSTSRTIYCDRSGNDYSGGLIVLTTGGQVSTLFNSGGGSWGTNYTTTATVPIGSWTHIAVTRESSTNYWRTFVNGVLDNIVTAFGNPTQSGTVTLGRDNGAAQGDFKGFISNARVVKGSALYTNSFTPSLTPLKIVTGTQMLAARRNPANPSSLSDGTGKTTNVFGNTVTSAKSPWDGSVRIISSSRATGGGTSFSTHQPGDLLLVAELGWSASYTAGNKPAGWNLIAGSTSGGLAVLYYKFASSYNETFPNPVGGPQVIFGVVLRGAHPSPIGAATATSQITPTASLSLQNNSGKSVILKYGAMGSNSLNGTAPDGYFVVRFENSWGICIAKLDTTSDNSVHIPPFTSTSGGIKAAVEILPA